MPGAADAPNSLAAIAASSVAMMKAAGARANNALGRWVSLFPMGTTAIAPTKDASAIPNNRMSWPV